MDNDGIEMRISMHPKLINNVLSNDITALATWKIHKEDFPTKQALVISLGWEGTVRRKYLDARKLQL